jgi:hypothetical protein
MPLHCTSRVQLEGRNREKVMEEMAEKLPKRDAMMMKDLTGHDDQMAATMADTAAAGKVYRSDLAPCMDRACTPHIPARTCHAYSACYVPCQAAWKSAENVGTGWEAAAPLAPKDGFCNERYRCRTMASFDMGDRDDFEKLFCGDEEEPAGERLTLAFKGINDDHCQVVYYSLLTTHYSLLTAHDPLLAPAPYRSSPICLRTSAACARACGSTTTRSATKCALVSSTYVGGFEQYAARST